MGMAWGSAAWNFFASLSLKMGAIPTWLWPYSGGGGKDFPIHHNPSYLE
jgi:hypothetical protein